LSDEAEFDLNALLGIPAKKPEEPTPFEKTLGVALAAAVAAMREQRIIEVEDANVEALVTELRNAASESNSLKRLLKRVVNAMVYSERVEEVYGTDEDLSAFLRRFFEGA